MPLESLAKIFGPTIVGHASAKPDPSVQWSDVEKQPKACALILSFPSYHYTLSPTLLHPPHSLPTSPHPPPPSLQVVLRLLNISPDYWRQYLSPMENPEPMTSPNIGSAQSSPGFTSPATPEQRPGTCCTDSVHVQCTLYIHVYIHVYIRKYGSTFYIGIVICTCTYIYKQRPGTSVYSMYIHILTLCYQRAYQRTSNCYYSTVLTFWASSVQCIYM